MLQAIVLEAPPRRHQGLLPFDALPLLVHFLLRRVERDRRGPRLLLLTVLVERGLVNGSDVEADDLGGGDYVRRLDADVVGEARHDVGHGEHNARHILDLAEAHVGARFATVVIRRVRFALYDVEAAVAPRPNRAARAPGERRPHVAVAVVRERLANFPVVRLEAAVERQRGARALPAAAARRVDELAREVPVTLVELRRRRCRGERRGVAYGREHAADLGRAARLTAFFPELPEAARGGLPVPLVTAEGQGAAFVIRRKRFDVGRLIGLLGRLILRNDVPLDGVRRSDAV